MKGERCRERWKQSRRAIAELTLVVPLDLGMGGHDGAEETRLGVVSLIVGLRGGSHDC